MPYDRVGAVLWPITIAVVALGIFREGWFALYGNNSPLGGLPLINLDSDNALGEWWSVLQLTLAAILVAINGMAEPSRRWKPYWFVLAGMFVFLSFDENVGVHEYVVQWLPTHADFLLFSWIIPYGVISLAIGFFYLPFVLALPRHIRWRVILAGALFIAAAIGMGLSADTVPPSKVSSAANWRSLPKKAAR